MLHQFVLQRLMQCADLIQVLLRNRIFSLLLALVKDLFNDGEKTGRRI